MPQSDRFPRIPPQFSFLTLTKHKLALSVLALFLSGLFCLAQEQSRVPQVSTPNLGATEKNNLLVPAGTRIALVLIRSRADTSIAGTISTPKPLLPPLPATRYSFRPAHLFKARWTSSNGRADGWNCIFNTRL